MEARLFAFSDNTVQVKMLSQISSRYLSNAICRNVVTQRFDKVPSGEADEGNLFKVGGQKLRKMFHKTSEISCIKKKIA